MGGMNKNEVEFNFNITHGRDEKLDKSMRRALLCYVE